MPRNANAAAPSPEPQPETALVATSTRHDGWTPQRQRQFIEVLADTGSVSAAAHAVGMTRETAYRLRRHRDGRAFDAAWEAALERSMQRLLPAAIDRALNGTLRQRWYHGQVVDEERVYSDGLMRFLLERGDKMLGAARARQALREDWETHMDALEAGNSAPPEPAPPPEAEWEEANEDEDEADNADPNWLYDLHPDGRWVTSAAPPPGFDPDLEVTSDPFQGWRYCIDEEIEAIERFEAEEAAEEEAARRRFFELPPQSGEE